MDYRIDNSGPEAGLEGYIMRIRPVDLQQGHYVVALNIPWRDSPFPLEGVLVQDVAQRQWLVDHCDWVDIDINRSPNKFRPANFLRYVDKKKDWTPSAKQIARCEEFREQRITKDNLEVSRSMYDLLHNEVERIVSDFSQSGRVEIDSARRIIDDITHSLGDNVAALAWLIRIKSVDQYTAQHCINVSILSIMLAYAAGWDAAEVKDAGMAGLLHDLGKTRLNQAIVNKPGRLTPKEFEHIKAHSMLGYKMLLKDDNISDAIRMAVRHHHERPDGTGYPDGLSEDEIPALASLVAVIDAYDAITSDRIYDPARSHHEALGILYKQRNLQFDAELVEVFIRFMGWVTYGTLVRLTDARLAVVLEAKSGRGFYPLVRIVEAGADGNSELGELVDLHTLKLREGSGGLRVAEVLPDGSHGIEVRQLIDRF